MSCMACDDKMTIGTFVTVRNADLRVVQSDDDVALQFGSWQFELTLGEGMVDKLIPVLADAKEHFRRVEEAAEAELQDA